MYQRFRLGPVRPKDIWPTGLLWQLRQVETGLEFDIGPSDVQGWYGSPRQSEIWEQMEYGKRVVDYGPQISKGLLKFSHPLVLQDSLDGLYMYALGKPDMDWFIFNHRGDRYQARLSQQWAAHSEHTIQDMEGNTEPAPIGLAQDNYSFFWDSYAAVMLYTKSSGGTIYVGTKDGGETRISLGANPSLAVSTTGVRYLAYERSGAIYMQTQDSSGLWSSEITIMRNDNNNFKGSILYDQSAVYSSPAVLAVADRMWLVYLKTNGNESVIQYRIEKQNWLFARDIPTMGGKKSHLKAIVSSQNAACQGEIVMVWINWDPTERNGSVLVPNVYLTRSTIPRIAKDLFGRDVVSVKDEIPATSSLRSPADSLGIQFTRA